MKIYIEFCVWCAAVGFLVGVVSACPPSPVAPPPDATDAIAPTPPVTVDAPPSAPASCDAACGAMQAAGCVVLADCAATMCKVNADPRFQHYDTGCLARAKTAADVKGCGADCTPPTAPR